MQKMPFAFLVGYFFALAVAAAATMALLLMREEIQPSIIYLLFLLPVVVTTLFWGLGPGIISAFLCFLAINFFFIQPYYSLAVHQSQDIVVLIIFLGVAVGISQMMGRVQRSLAAAAAREHEAIRLYELGKELAGTHDDRDIVHILASQALDTFQADRVEIILEAQPDRRPISLNFPEDPARIPDSAAPGARPSILVPLQTIQGLIGEIRIWRERPFGAAAEERLLRTFASQGVLALEKARLLETENRARVLEESDQMKSALLSSVSHELRTPLSTIKAAVTSLRSATVPWDSEARADLLAAIEEETDHLNQLVGNLLNMSRIESGALKPQRNWNDLGEIVSSVLHRRRILTHQMVVDIPDNLPLVPVDEMQMEQVFTNLISNSLKYSPENTTIRISAGQHDEDHLEVQVSNEGPAVAEDSLERIFDKFYRVTASEQITGTGLGLSICKGIVEAHGGRIWAENQPGKFVFHFTLPLSWADKPQKSRRPKLPVE